MVRACCIAFLDQIRKALEYRLLIAQRFATLERGEEGGMHVMVMFLQNLFYKQLSALQGFIMNKNEESAFFRKEVQG